MDRHSRLIVELADIAARLATTLLVTLRAIYHIYITRALDQSIEIVGIDTFVVLGRGQAVCCSQTVRDKRRGRGTITWEVIVVHREDYHIIEIEVTRFENTHNLHTVQRLTLERDTHRLQMATQERGIDRQRNLYCALIERLAQLHNILGHHRQILSLATQCIISHRSRARRLGHHRQQIVRHLLPLDNSREELRQQGRLRQLLARNIYSLIINYLTRKALRLLAQHIAQVWMRQQTQHIAMVEPLIRATIAAAILQLNQSLHERIGHRLSHRETHRYIQLHALGHRVEQRLQQILVGEHNRRALIHRHAIGHHLTQQSIDIFTLQHIRGCRHRRKLLIASRKIINLRCEGRTLRIAHQILAQKQSCLLMLIKIVTIVIPIEVRRAIDSKIIEQTLLTLRERIETRYDIVCAAVLQLKLTRLDTCDSLALDHTAIANSQLAQSITKAVIDRT